jgi:hypothetical protein
MLETRDYVDIPWADEEDDMVSVTVGASESSVGGWWRGEPIPSLQRLLDRSYSLGFVGALCAREGAHCHTWQAPPIRARIRSVSQSGDHIPNILSLDLHISYLLRQSTYSQISA